MRNAGVEGNIIRRSNMCSLMIRGGSQMGGRYDDALRKKLSGQKKLTQLWAAALGRNAEEEDMR